LGFELTGKFVCNPKNQQDAHALSHKHTHTHTHTHSHIQRCW